MKRRIRVATNDRHFGQFVPLLSLARIHIHSDEETDFEGDLEHRYPVFATRTIPWRSSLLRLLLHSLDRLHNISRNNQGRAQRGRKSLPRVMTDRPTTRAPPLGLPKNCYHEGYLRSRGVPISTLLPGPDYPIDRELLDD